MENKEMLGLIILFFIGVIVVLALIPQIAENVKVLKDTVSISNEVDLWTAANGMLVETNADYTVNTSKNITVTHYPSGWNQANCPISGVTITLINGTSFTENTDYYLYPSEGKFSFLTSAQVNSTIALTSLGNQSNSSYTFCPPGYISSAGGRAVAGLILIMASVGLLGFAVWFILKRWY